VKTEWDYTDRAHTYDQRADYSQKAINYLIKKIDCEPKTAVADIGAGTGKLTKHLLDHGLTVYAIEPNDNMRDYGVNNTKSRDVQWSEGVGEKTGLPDACVYAVFFGSSFNVVDQKKTLKECSRILRPGGWFACMWNHRDIEDSLQKTIERKITSFIPDYDYGLRRQDPSRLILESKNFKSVSKIEQRFKVKMTRTSIIDAWKSHDTLYRQSGNQFDHVINAIAESLTEDEYMIPYYTRIWFSQFVS